MSVIVGCYNPTNGSMFWERRSSRIVGTDFTVDDVLHSVGCTWDSHNLVFGCFSFSDPSVQVLLTLRTLGLQFNPVDMEFMAYIEHWTLLDFVRGRGRGKGVYGKGKGKKGQGAIFRL